MDIVAHESVHQPIVDALRSIGHSVVAVVELSPGISDDEVLALASKNSAVLLTRRGGRMRRHRGQWALPGGRADDGEKPSQTARRELAEELGLSVNEEQVLGVLDDDPTRSGFAITPVVIWGGRIGDLRPDPDEVEAAYRVPLDDLEYSDVPRLERIAESDRLVLSIPFASLDQSVFAPTAAMLYQFREVALHGRATRVADYDQPVFAWR